MYKWGVREVEAIFDNPIPACLPIKMAGYHPEGWIVYPIERW